MIAAFPPEQPEVRFTVFGIPQPQGSARMVPISAPCPRCHRREQRITSDNPKLKPWRELVRRVADIEGLQPLAGPVRVSLHFMLRRPKSHYRANGELRADAPRYPTTRPDEDKLRRAILDALTGVAYLDDAQVVDGIQLKRYATGTPGVEIRIEAMS